MSDFCASTQPSFAVMSAHQMASDSITAAAMPPGGLLTEAGPQVSKHWQNQSADNTVITKPWL